MKRSLPLLVWTLCASAAFAEPSTKAQDAATELVDKQLLAPLRKAESARKRFSRSAPVPVERRVRVLDAEALVDVRGREFVRFAVDVRRAWDAPDAWHNDTLTGCAYPREREVFVQHGRAYVSAKHALGKEGQRRADVCRSAKLNARDAAG
jgi:hypothetical protein